MLNKIFANIKMKHKIILVAVVSVILVWVAVVSIAVASIKNIYDKKIDRIINQTVEQTSKYVSTEYNNIINLVHYSMAGDDMQSAMHLDINGSKTDYILAESIIVPSLMQLRLQNKLIDSVTMILKGQWFDEGNYPTNYDLEKTLEQGKMTKLIYWSPETILNKGTGKDVLPVILRVPSGDFRAQDEAYMIVNIDANELFDYMSSLERNLQCYLVLHSGDKVVFGNEEMYKNRNDDRYIVNETDIHINGWTISCIIDRSVIYADLNIAMMHMLMGSVVIAFICLLLATYVAKTITIPIHQLMEQAKKIEKGDFSVRVNFSGKDEIGDLGYSFNAMCKQIQNYIQMLEDEKNQVSIIEHQKRKAEMKALQSQINPHFLYNTLDSLYWYSLAGKKKEIGQIVLDLSKLLRIGLSKGEEIIGVGDEIKHVENYLRIQKVIFSDKFDYSITTNPEVFNYRILKIILQPLVENCLNHAFLNMESGGMIHVHLDIEQDDMVIKVIDNGCGFEKAKEYSKTMFSGYALKNIRERLKLHYEQDADIQIDSIPDVNTTVTIRIALQRMI